MKSTLTTLIIIFLIGLGLGFYLHQPDTIIENTETVKIDTLTIIDTIQVEIPTQTFEPAIPDKIEKTSKGLIRSEKTFETSFADIRVSALAESKVELFTLELLNIKPMIVPYEKEIIQVEKIKTITVELPWYDTRTVHWIEGAAVMYLLFQGASKLK